MTREQAEVLDRALSPVPAGCSPRAALAATPGLSGPRRCRNGCQRGPASFPQPAAAAGLYGGGRPFTPRVSPGAPEVCTEPLLSVPGHSSPPPCCGCPERGALLPAQLRRIRLLVTRLLRGCRLLAARSCERDRWKPAVAVILPAESVLRESALRACASRPGRNPERSPVPLHPCHLPGRCPGPAPPARHARLCHQQAELDAAKPDFWRWDLSPWTLKAPRGAASLPPALWHHGCGPQLSVVPSTEAALALAKRGLGHLECCTPLLLSAVK